LGEDDNKDQQNAGLLIDSNGEMVRLTSYVMIVFVPKHKRPGKMFLVHAPLIVIVHNSVTRSDRHLNRVHAYGSNPVFPFGSIRVHPVGCLDTSLDHPTQPT